MSRPKKFKERRSISFSVECEYYEHLKRQAVYMSNTEEGTLSLTEIIRRGLEVVYPLPNSQMKFKY